jgi:hypothetical protein
MDVEAPRGVLRFFEELEDPRMDRTKLHALSDILFITLCAVLCGANSWAEVELYGRSKEQWLRQFVPLANGIPSHDTFGRVFSRLDPTQLEQCFVNWMRALAQISEGRLIAIDGKTLRRSFDKADNRLAIHMVSAWCEANHLVLGQVATEEKSNEIRHCSTVTGNMLSGPRMMKRSRRLPPALGLGIAEHVHGDSFADVRAGADAVDRLLHLAVAAIAPFDGIGGRRQQGIVQEGQRLFQRGREQLVERLTKGLEATNSLAKSCQFGQRRVIPATAVEQTVSFIDDLSDGSQAGLSTCDSLKGLSLRRCQVVLDEQMTVVKQIGNLRFDAFLAGRQFAVGPRRSPSADLGKRGLQLTANLGHGLEDGLVQFGDDVELADLMADRPEDFGHGRGVQLRTVGGDALQAQPTSQQGFLKPREEPDDVFLRGIVIEDFVDQSFEPMVVHDRQNAVRPVVQFIGGDIAGEVGQGGIEVILSDAFGSPFFPPLPPSSGPWQTGRRRGDRATSARKPTDTADRPRPPAVPPRPPPDECSGCWGRPSPTGRR